MWTPSWQEWVIIGVVIGVLLIAWAIVACRFLPCCCVYRILARRRKSKEYEVHKWSISYKEDPVKPVTMAKTETAPLRSEHKYYGTDGSRMERVGSPDRSSTQSTDSWVSIPDDDTPSLPSGEPARGTLELTLKLNYNEQVVVTVHRAKNLWSFTGSGGIQETFCIIHLLHHEEDTNKTKRADRERHVVYEGRTAPKRRTHHPEFNENFTLPMNLVDINNRVLLITLWAYDKHDNLEAVGEVTIHFDEVDLKEGETVQKELEEAHQQKKGELCLSLCYRPTAEKLSVIPIDAKGLALPQKDKSDLSVKVVIMERGKVRIRKKSKIHTASENMKFEEDPIVLDIPQDRLSTVALLVSLVQMITNDEKDLSDKSSLIGKVAIGLNLGEDSNDHWRNMMRNPREPVIHTHVLR